MDAAVSDDTDAFKHCPIISSCQMGNDMHLTSYCHSESSLDRNINAEADVQSYDAERCCFEAESWQQPKQETRSMTSSAAEPETDADNCDNDVGWFFDDTSDVHVSHEEQTCEGVANCFRSANKLADVSPNRIMFDDKSVSYTHLTLPTIYSV